MLRGRADDHVQRAKALVDSMTDALDELNLETPVGQRNLWLEEQSKNYNMALNELLKFIWSKV